MTAQFGGNLRYASSRPGEFGQLLNLAVGPLLWLLCFHGAALHNLPPCLPVSLVAHTWEIYGWCLPPRGSAVRRLWRSRDGRARRPNYCANSIGDRIGARIVGVVDVGRSAIKGRSDLPYASAGPPLLTRKGKASPRDRRTFEMRSDGGTQSPPVTLKWQTAARPLGVR